MTESQRSAKISYFNFFGEIANIRLFLQAGKEKSQNLQILTFLMLVYRRV